MVDIVVETGSVVTGANVYDTFENVSTYFDNQGYDWAGESPDDDKYRAMIRAASVLDARWGIRFPGTKTGARAQSLAWPRSDVTDIEDNEIPDDEIPTEIKKAFYELTWREFQEPGSTLPDYTQTERTVSETLGPLSVTYASTNEGGKNTDGIPVYHLVDKILEPLIGAAASTMFGQTTRV